MTNCTYKYIQYIQSSTTLHWFLQKLEKPLSSTLFNLWYQCSTFPAGALLRKSLAGIKLSVFLPTWPEDNPIDLLPVAAPPSSVPSTVRGKMEDQDPEQPHSVQNLQVPHASPSVPPEHRRVRGSEWCHFNEDVDAALEASSRGAVNQCLQLMCTLIVSISVERSASQHNRTPGPTNGRSRPLRSGSHRCL